MSVDMLAKQSGFFLKRTIATSASLLGSHSPGLHHGQCQPPGRLSGVQQLGEARSTKGLSFTLEERQLLGIHGLLPPRVMTMDEAADHSLRNLRRYK